MPRRILLLITDLEIGGTPTVVRELATRLHSPPEVEVEVACLSKWGPVADQIKAAGVEVTALNATRPTQVFGVTRRLVHMLRARRFDTVFSFLVHANAVAAAAKPFCRGVRFIQSIQTTQPGPRWHWKLQRAVQLTAARVVVPSQAVADVAQAWSKVPREKIDIIPNAVDPDQFPRSSISALDPRPYPIGFIGRLDPVKQVHDLVTAVAMMVARPPRLVHLHIFGDGRERERIEAEVRRLNAQDAVTIHGVVARPQEALAQIGLLVLPSKAEGFGLVLIEAMAAGVPVIASDIPGIRDVIRDGETGILTDPAGPGVLLVDLNILISNPQVRARLVENGLVEVRQRFSWEVVVGTYRKLLDLPPR